MNHRPRLAIGCSVLWKRLLFATSFGICLMGCGNVDTGQGNIGTQTSPEEHTAAPGKDTQDDWKTLDREMFSIQYPADWSFVPSDNAVFVLMSPRRTHGNQLMESINLQTESIFETGWDLKEYGKLGEQSIVELLPGSKMLESKQVKEGDRAYHRLIYLQDQGRFQRTFMQYYYVDGDYGYVLTYTAATDQFDQFQELGARIMATFKIKPKVPAVSVKHWKTLQEDNCSIPYPAGWKVQKTDSASRKFLLTAPEDHPEDSYLENMQLVTAALPNHSAKLEAFVQEEKAELERTRPDFHVHQQSQSTINGRQFFQMQYSCTENGVRMKYFKDYRLVGDLVYVLIFSAEEWRFAGMEHIATGMAKGFIVNP